MSGIVEKVKTESAEGIEKETFPQLLRRNCLIYGDKLAMRKKDLGIWQEYTWRDVYEHVKYFSLGLISLGLEKGDRVIVIGNNEPQHFWAEWAIQAARAIFIGIFVDSLGDELKYYIDSAEPRFVIAEDQEQVDKLISIKPECSTVESVIFWDIKGLWFYDEPYLMNFEHVEDLGKEYESEHTDLFEENIEQTEPGDVCVFCYTSGTTGLPKGAMLSYRNLLACGRGALGFNPLQPFDNFVAYMTTASGAQLLDIPFLLDVPLIANFAEEPDTVQADARDIGAVCYLYPPRQWEDLARQVRVKAEDTSWWKRWLFNRALKVGFKVVEYRSRGHVPPLWKMRYKLADWVIFRSVRDHIGTSKSRVCVSGGGAISSKLIMFFNAMGVSFVNMYGAIEIGLMVSLSPEEQLRKPHVIGRPAKGFELKIENDEICLKGPGGFKGYWKGEDLYDQKVKDGWFHTGDGGSFDEDGYLVFWDRIEELISLKDGSRFSPQFIETHLRASPYIKDAIVIGGSDRDCVVAIISVDFGMVSKWAEIHRIPYTTYVELSQEASVLELVDAEVKKVNELVPSSTRIKKFISLHKEFDPDEAELTRTRKLKRAVMHEKYDALIKGMYEGKDSVLIEAEVTYRDKRKGKISAEVKVNEVSDVAIG